jgi:FixJ family two-component response regulator
VSAPGPPSGFILATAHPGDTGDLGEALRGSPWTVRTAGDLPGTVSGLADATIPIVLYDRDLPGPSWQEAFEALASVRKQAALILLSNVSDPYLADEVVEHGGFDVLTRPFRREDVLTMLLFARSHCTARWPPA